MAAEVESRDIYQLSLERSNQNQAVGTSDGDGINRVSSGDQNIGWMPIVAVRSSVTAHLKATLFQRTLIFALVRLVIYLNKLYQDFGATYEYKDERDYNFFAISIISLVAPSIIYALFLIGADLSKDDEVDGKIVSTKACNGILLIPWQIKSHLDVLYEAAKKACLCESPTEDEEKKLKEVQLSAEILEFFENFYAGFLQILLQTYVFLGTMDWIDSHKLRIKPLVSVLVGSILSVMSMMIAVRRRDDGKLTHFLSFFGWLSFISSRVLVFSLVTTVIHSWMAVLCLIHILAFSIWIYNIAIESYGVSSSSANMTSSQWSDRRKRLSIAVLVFLFFGVPSLFIWPIMFQLKERKRPLIFLLVCTIENLLLLGIWLIWLMSNQGSHLSDSLVLFIIGIVVATLAGDFLLMMYVFCKPKLTDTVVLITEIQESQTMGAPTLVRLDGTRGFQGSLQYGVLYEFCKIVFKIPVSHKTISRLEEVRRFIASDSNH